MIKRQIVSILLADDDADDREMTREAFEENRFKADLRFVVDGQDLLDYLKKRGKYINSKNLLPGLILLDLNMPKMDGREALKEIKLDPELRVIPVVVLTTSKADEDMLKCYALGANSFITKPVTFEGLVEATKVIGKYWFELVDVPNGK
jgi:CheY-like chemotaxis protein